MATTGLGRGLGSLIPPKNASASNAGDSAPEDNNGLLELDVDKIEVNPMQPRKQFTDYKLEELTESIKEHGVIQPLIVSKKNGKFELVAGERRLRASKEAGLAKVPVIIRSVNEQEKLTIALIENIQREDLNSIDLAHAYRKLIDEFNITQEEASRRVGKSRSAIANTMRFLNLSEEMQIALINGRISEGHAKYLVGLDSEEKRMNLFRKIIHNNLTVQDVNKEAKKMGGTKAARIKINYADKDKEFALREFFGSKVEIRRTGKGGQIIIDFYSDEELGEMIGKVEK